MNLHGLIWKVTQNPLVQLIIIANKYLLFINTRDTVFTVCRQHSHVLTWQPNKHGMLSQRWFKADPPMIQGWSTDDPNNHLFI